MTDLLLSQQAFCVYLVITVGSLLLAGIPVAISLAGGALLVALAGSLAGSFDPALLGAIPQRIFTIMRNEVLVAVPFFILMGSLLEQSGLARALLDHLGHRFHRLPGGLGVGVCLAGALLAASTGIVGATVVTLGLLSLPSMLKAGYPASTSCGIVGASGTLGQIIPPSILLILLADQVAVAHQQAQYDRGNFAAEAVSIADLFAAALLPGLLLVLVYTTYIVIRYRSVPGRSAPRDASADSGQIDLNTGRLALFAPLVLILAVLGSIIAGFATPTEAAALGAAGSLLLSGGNSRRLRLARWSSLVALALALLLGGPGSGSSWPTNLLVAVLVLLFTGGFFVMLRHGWRYHGEDGQPLVPVALAKTLATTVMIFFIVIGASVFSLVLRGFGGDRLVHDVLTGLPGGLVGALAVTMLVIFLLGFMLDFIEILYIVVPVVVPVLLGFDTGSGLAVNPLWLAVLIALNLQTSFLTPPFGLALFYLRGVLPDGVSITAVYRGVIPFVALQIVVLGMVVAFPAIATWLPGVIYGR